MKKFNIFTVLLIAVTITAVLLTPVSLALDDPDIKAESALMVEIESGIILYQNDMNKRVAPGGAARVMTLLLAVEAIENEQLSLLDKVTPSETLFAGIEEDDTVLGIEPGETMKLEDLLYSAYISGAADACNIIAEYLAGDINTFVQRMNLKALALGCKETHFSNPGGLSDFEQYTTAWDQYLIFKDAVEHTLFVKIAGTPAYKTNPTIFVRERSLINTNEMLRTDSQHYYQRCIAGCFDSNTESGQNFLTCADNGELTFITVLFGAAQREEEAVQATEETEDEAEIYEVTDTVLLETRRLLDWGFDNFAWQIVLDESEIVARENVEMADGTGNVELRPDRTISVLARTDLTTEEIVKDVILFSWRNDGSLTAPIMEGTVLGEVTVMIDGSERGRAELIAAREVGLNEKMYIQNQLNETLEKKWVQLSIGLFLTVVIGYVVLVIHDIKRRRKKRRAMEDTKRKIIDERQHKRNTYR